MQRITARRIGTAMLQVSIAVAFAVGAAGQAHAGDVDYAKFMKEKSSPLVTVKFVLKMNMGGMMGGMGDQETDTEITGVMIRPDGLVLVSNTPLGGFAGMMRRFAASRGSSITATPTDMKVLIGEDTEGVEAELLARDTELDLAWIKIKEPGGKTFDYLDLSDSATVKIGDPIVSVNQMGKYYARCAVVGEGRIGGITEKPRKLYVPSGPGAGGMGLPSYTREGKVVGITVMQTPEPDASGNPFSMASSMQGGTGVFILPAANVVKATERALASAEDEE